MGKTNSEIGLFPANYIELGTKPSNVTDKATSISPLPKPEKYSNVSEIPIIKSLKAFETLVETGFVVEIDPQSEGTEPVSWGQVVEVHVIAMTWNGAEGSREEFSSTRSPISIPMRFVLDGSAVTKGLHEGLLLLKVGQRALITCAPSLAYGEVGMPPLVKPNSYIVYHVEVLGVGGECAQPLGPSELLRTTVATREHTWSVSCSAPVSEQEELLVQAAEQMRFGGC